MYVCMYVCTSVWPVACQRQSCKSCTSQSGYRRLKQTMQYVRNPQPPQPTHPHPNHPNHPNHPSPNHLTHPSKAGTALLPCSFRRRCADVAYMCETDRQIRQMFGLICMSA